MNSYEGSCSCGRIQVVFFTDFTPEHFALRSCQCEFCLKHSAVSVSDLNGVIFLSLPKDGHVPFRSGMRITDFHLCHNCKKYVAATWVDASEMRAVVNVNALKNLPTLPQPINVNFDGESKKERELRRKLTWTPCTIKLNL
jgi:hypothetical protein